MTKFSAQGDHHSTTPEGFVSLTTTTTGLTRRKTDFPKFGPQDVQCFANAAVRDRVQLSLREVLESGSWIPFYSSYSEHGILIVKVI